jgi:hypothetical protein
MFDRHVVAGDDDAFHEKPHEPLATGEVEVGEARAQGGGEGGEILAQSIAPRAIHLLRRQFLCASPRRRTRGVEPLAARLELLDAECAALIRVDQALDLQPGLPLDPLEAGKIPHHLTGAVPTRAPGGDLLDQELRTLYPRAQRVPDDGIHVVAAHPSPGAPLHPPALDRIVMPAGVVEVLVRLGRPHLVRTGHSQPARTADHQPAQEVLVLHVSR